ncbi:MAG: molecular chaperone [Anaerolineae bacterium]
MSMQNGKGEGGAPSPFNPTSSFSRLELAQVRQVIYQLFGSLFLYPRADRVAAWKAVAAQLVQDEAVWLNFPFHESWLRLLHLLVDFADADQLAIEEEYVRLFTVNPVAIPQESFYVDVEGLAHGLIMAHLEQEYRESGLETSSDIVESPDHVAVELEFMAFLCDKEGQALRITLYEEANQLWGQQRTFLRKHLGRWFPKFAKRAKNAEPNRLYASLNEAAFLFLRHELSLLGIHH